MNGNCEQHSEFNNTDTTVVGGAEVCYDVAQNGTCKNAVNFLSVEKPSASVNVVNTVNLANGTSEHERLDDIDDDDYHKLADAQCNGFNHSASLEVLDRCATSQCNSPLKRDIESKVKLNSDSANHGAVNGDCSISKSSSQSSIDTISSLKRALDRTNGPKDFESHKRPKRSESDSHITNGEHAEKLVLTKPQLEALLKAKLHEFIKSKKGDLLAEMQRKIDELHAACATWSAKYKELQKQVVEASIVKQRMKRNAANNKVVTKNVCQQVNEQKLLANQKQQAAAAAAAIPIQQRLASQLIRPSPASSQPPVGSLMKLSSPSSQIGPPTVRQLISNQKAASTLVHALSASSPAILRHASLPQVVDLTEDDETGNIVVPGGSLSAYAAAATKSRTITIDQSTFPELLKLATTPTAATTRPVQVVPPNGSLRGGAPPVGRCGSTSLAPCPSTPVIPNGLPRQNGGSSSSLMQALTPSPLSAQQLSGTTNSRLPVQPAVATPHSAKMASGAMFAAATPAVHPAPLPPDPVEPANTLLKPKPPRPILKLQRVEQGIVLSWNVTPYNKDDWAEIASYQLYAYQETSAPPSTSLWKLVGNVNALALPMACTLTQFQTGNTYHFAVRAVDEHKRIGPFSEAATIFLAVN